MRTVFIICPVRIATPEVVARLEAYADMLEDNDVEVHLPHRDTNQCQSGLNINRENAMAMFLSNEIHIFYDPNSQGTHFDMGVAFALDQLCGHKKKIKLVAYSGEDVHKKPGYGAFISDWIYDKVYKGEQEMEYEYENE
jgi:hypothetical protein